jgi:hypothetical protein
MMKMMESTIRTILICPGRFLKISGRLLEMERVVQLRPYGLQFYKPEENPYGLRCCDCNYLFMVRGEPVAEILVGIKDDTPVVELVCMKCAKEVA